MLHRRVRHLHNGSVGRRLGTIPGRRLAFAALLAVGAPGCFAASAAADQQIVTATVYTSSGSQQESLSLAALQANSNQCPEYMGTLAVQHGQGGQTTTPNFTGGEVWALSTILACLQPEVPSGAVKGVTIIQADSTPEASSGSQLTAADLNPASSDFADPSEVPVIGNQGTDSAASIQYDRPWRGGDDNNFNDQVTETTGAPVAIEVFEGQLLTVTPSASATTVPAGSSVSFSATFQPANVSGVTYSWNFDGGAANSTASAPTVTFTTGGTYKVSVQVTDDDGGGGVGTIPITVTSPAPPSGSNVGTKTGPKNSGGTGGGTPGKHRGGNRGQGHTGSHGNGSTGGKHSSSPKSGSHSPPTPAGSGASTTTTPSSGSSTPAPRQPATTPSAAPRERAHHSTSSHLKTPAPAAPGAQAPVVTGRLVSDVTPIPAGESPLVHVEAGVAASAQAARHGAGTSPVAPIVAGLAVLALLALGARRELRGRGDWRTLRFGS